VFDFSCKQLKFVFTIITEDPHWYRYMNNAFSYAAGCCSLLESLGFGMASQENRTTQTGTTYFSEGKMRENLYLTH